MSVFTSQMKVHSREDITSQFTNLHNCKIHNCLPEIQRIVSGRNKYIDFVAFCKDDSCIKIADSTYEIEKIWNQFNPILSLPS